MNVVFVTHECVFSCSSELGPAIAVDPFGVPVRGEDEEEFVDYGFACCFVFEVKCECPTAELIGNDEPLFVGVLSEVEMNGLEWVEHW